MHIPLEKGRIILLAGPTASGKSALALKIAQETDAVIINADSMQVYRELPIITAQPTPEERIIVPHLLYGCIAASEPFSVGTWLAMAKQEIDAAIATNRTPIITGGTGLYFKCLTKGIAHIPSISCKTKEKSINIMKDIGNISFYTMLSEKDPAFAATLSPGNTQRLLRAWEVWAETGIPFSEWQRRKHEAYYEPERFAGYFLNPERQDVYERINRRFSRMLENGALEEVRRLMGMELSPRLPSMKAHGVPELTRYLQGKTSLEDAISKAQQHTRNYAKRQCTWFRHQLPEFTWLSKNYSEDPASR